MTVRRRVLALATNGRVVGADYIMHGDSIIQIEKQSVVINDEDALLLFISHLTNEDE